MTLPRSLVLAAFTASCASTGRMPPPKVDLEPARQAIETARAAGAPQRAPETFTRAVGHLEEAEKLQGTAASEKARDAQWLAQLAVAEANLSAALAAGQHRDDAAKAAAATAADTDRLTAQLRRAEEEQRRLNERLAVLQRELEFTEEELIRTKARLKGNETRAEASSAIAEAHILIRRLADEKVSPGVLNRAREAVSKAEQQFEAGNYGAAVFFALKAQDAARTRGTSP